MTPFSCDQLADVADEMALDALPGDLRSLALDHLGHCAACRAVVDDLAATADELLLAFAVADPPPGFEDRVLSRIEDERQAGSPRRSRRRPRGASWAVRMVAVAAAVGSGLLIAPRLLGSGRPPAGVSAWPGRARLGTIRLVSAGGAAVGDVSVYDGRPAWVFMQVDRGLAPGTYWCVLDVAGGRSIPMGTLTVTGGRSGWGEHVAVAASDIRAARVVDAAGTTVATAWVN